MDSGCNRCPAYAKCTAAYRGSACASMRASYGLHTDPFTNADCIRFMSDEELAKERIERMFKSNMENKYYSPMYLCSDGWGTNDYNEAVSHELDWLHQPAEEGGNK